MKTTATIFLLVLLVFVQTPVGQLLKLPILIEHFVKHKVQNGFSLIDFLEDHYTSDHKDADTQQDEQLPFKNIIFHTIGNAIVPGIIKTIVLVPSLIDEKVIFTNTYAPQQHLASIFRPPRV